MMRFFLLLLLLLAQTQASPVVRTQRELEMVRARHADVPLWGHTFDDAHPETHAAVELAARGDPRDGASVALHARTVAEFAGQNASVSERVPLNEAARTHRRRLGASSYTAAHAFLGKAGAGCFGLLVHWAGEKQLARATFARLFEERLPGVPHADACSRTRSPRERALLDRIPVHPHEHTLVFFAARVAPCVAHAHAVAEFEAAFGNCTREGGEWMERCRVTI
jgi:hypothetical protein